MSWFTKPFQSFFGKKEQTPIPELRMQTENSLKVFMPHHPNIRSYCVRYVEKTLEQPLDHDIYTGKCSGGCCLPIERLQPGTCYRIWAEGIDENEGSVPKSKEIQISTLPMTDRMYVPNISPEASTNFTEDVLDEAENRDNVEISSTAVIEMEPSSSNKILLRWGLIPGVTEQEISYTNVSNPSLKETLCIEGENWLLVEDLLTSTEYEFTVRPIFGNRRGKFSKTKITTSTTGTECLDIKGACRFIQKIRSYSDPCFTTFVIPWAKPYETSIFHTLGDPGQFETKTLLFIGDGGSGKTTMICAMLNHLLHVNHTDNYRLKMHYKDKPCQAYPSEDPMMSYMVCGSATGLPFNLQLVDTADFGSVKGQDDTSHEKNITDRLLRFKRVDVVCFVVAASSARLVGTPKFVLNSVLPTVINITKADALACITHADSGTPPVLSALCEAPVGFKDILSFNNSTLFHDSKEDKSNLAFWENGKTQMTKLTTMLDE